MPRKKHEWYEGATLFVTAKGNHNNNIFLEESDYRLYLSYLKEADEYYGNKYHILAYVLMMNHVHLLIETKDKDISDLIKRVHSRYAWNFNKKYNYVGHLFQDRYKSNIIKCDSNILEASRYVHLNPVRSEVVKDPSDYPWSSYGAYMGGKRGKLIQPDVLLRYFNAENSSEMYKKFIESELN